MQAFTTAGQGGDCLRGVLRGEPAPAPRGHRHQRHLLPDQRDQGRGGPRDHPDGHPGRRECGRRQSVWRQQGH